MSHHIKDRCSRTFRSKMAHLLSPQELSISLQSCRFKIYLVHQSCHNLNDLEERHRSSTIHQMSINTLERTVKMNTARIMYSLFREGIDLIIHQLKFQINNRNRAKVHLLKSIEMNMIRGRLSKLCFHLILIISRSMTQMCHTRTLMFGIRQLQSR